jgi:hypothetical protein
MLPLPKYIKFQNVNFLEKTFASISHNLCAHAKFCEKSNIFCGEKRLMKKFILAPGFVFLIKAAQKIHFVS